MIPKRIEIENFLSFGEPAAVLRFDEEPLWVLSGPNGVGKSAVFDAITYALFGRHRGGAQNADKLIRHSANGFRIVFELEVEGADYRVTRTRSGRVTQKVERRGQDGAWEAIDLPRSRDPVGDWAEQTLGLGFDAFATSVLLRQGHADAIITSPPAERLQILKKVIGAERFEALSQRVHEAARRIEGRLEDLRARRDGLVGVTEAEVAGAEERLRQAEEARNQARAEAEAAAGRAHQAVRWQELEEKRVALERMLREGAERAAKADQLRREAARLRELGGVLPALRQVVSLRGRIAAAEDGLLSLREAEEWARAGWEECRRGAESARAEAAAHGTSAEEHEREAKRLRREIEQERKHLRVAEEVGRLRGQLARFAPDLDAQVQAAVCALRAVAESEAVQREARAKAAGLLEEAEARRDRFARVGVGVPCSRCRQVVDEEHARRERACLEAEVAGLMEAVRATTAAQQEATTAKGAAEAEQRRLAVLQRQRDDLRNRLATQLEVLAGLGVGGDVDALRDQIAAKEAEARQHEQKREWERDAERDASREVQRLTGEAQQREAECVKLGKRVRAAEATLAADRRQHETLVGQLPEAWVEQLAGLDEVAVAGLGQERAALAAVGVLAALALLEEDVALRAERTRQLEEVVSEIGKLPEVAHVAPAVAEQAARRAKAEAEKAERARDEAREARDELRRRADELRSLAEQVRKAEREHDLHRKLDDLLGIAGLQRELVRAAERAIARLANDTVQNLSEGDLSIDLEHESDGDKALALRVRRGGDPVPIEAAYLSGSQKFRVAVAVALAVGRFAAGQARRIDCVIIDEGFGSLDREGLLAAADEFNRLKGYLRRIVLVSHQEEFAERFGVGYRLRPGPAGTTVEAFRR